MVCIAGLATLGTAGQVRTQIDVAVLDQVQQPAWRRNHHVCAVRSESLNLGQEGATGKEG